MSYAIDMGGNDGGCWRRSAWLPHGLVCRVQYCTTWRTYEGAERALSRLLQTYPMTFALAQVVLVGDSAVVTMPMLQQAVRKAAIDLVDHTANPAIAKVVTELRAALGEE